MRRAVVLLPNGFTLANLFFGIFAIVKSARGEYIDAGWCVILGGVMDALDGLKMAYPKTTDKRHKELESFRNQL